jgi:anti-sigma regulatory factor (Ser/Thr protein kinase)
MGSSVLSLPSAPAAVGAARRWVRAQLSTVPRDQLDSVIWATSEAVTNSVVHGDGPVLVEVRPSQTGVRVEVTDRGSQQPRIRRQHDETEEGGRGLHIVELLASRWGVTPASPGPGKTVWFEVTSA